MSGFTFSPFVRAAAVIVGLAAFVLCSTHFPSVSATVSPSVFGERITSKDVSSAFKGYEPLKEDGYNPVLINFADDEDIARIKSEDDDDEDIALIESEDDDVDEFGMVASEKKTSSSDVVEDFRGIVNRVIQNKKTTPADYYSVLKQLMLSIKKTGQTCIRMTSKALKRGCTVIGNGCLRVAKRIFGEDCTSLGNALTRLVVVLFETGFCPTRTILRLAVMPILVKLKSNKTSGVDKMTPQALLKYLETQLIKLFGSD